MSRARSEHTDNLLLIAATTILILTAQRYFQTGTRGRIPAVPRSHHASSIAPVSQHGRGTALKQSAANPLGRLEGYPVAHL